MNFTLLQNLLIYVLCQRDNHTNQVLRTAVLLDCIVRENTQKTPVVNKPINVKLSATVIYLGIGLELSIVCISSPFPFSCSPYKSSDNVKEVKHAPDLKQNSLMAGKNHF